MKSGQVSTEFIFSLIILFVALTMLLAINFDKRSQLIDLEKFVLAREDCLKISNALNTLYTNGPESRTTLNVYNLVSIYNNSRIEINDNKTDELLTQCPYTAVFTDNLQNLTGQIRFIVDYDGIVRPG
ncbi:MAG TPA: hypothetical protein VJB94_04365 [Candidatus Nanoarchaeia archaeon]|nr:hypothetical protein [Candidatus Nanoarchaeia archaeon]